MTPESAIAARAGRDAREARGDRRRAAKKRARDKARTASKRALREAVKNG